MTTDAKKKNRRKLVIAIKFAAIAAVCTQSTVAADIPVLDCAIDPYEVVEVSSAAEGVIEKIHVERNDLVTKDQILAELESDVEKASLAFAQLNASLTTDIKLRRASLGFDQRNRTRIDELYTKKAIPLHHKDEAETDATKSKWLLTKAQDDKHLAVLELARAKAVVKRKTVRSPIDGVVVARHKSTGEYIEDQAILTIAQIDPLRVEVIVPVELFGAIDTGMSAKITPELVSTGVHNAKVISVDRVIDGASGTFDVRLELPNPDHKIPSGLKCQVEFDAGPSRPILDSAAVPLDPATADRATEFATTSDLTTSSADPGAVVCSAIGPFTNNGDADRIAEGLQVLPSRITPAQQFETVIDSYLVVAALQATNAATVGIQDEIRRHGVSGTKLIEAGEFKGQISFGTYADKRLAERRRIDLQKIGFPVQLKPRLERLARIWLHVEGEESDQSQVKSLLAAARAHPEMDLSVTPCGYPSAPAGEALALDE